MPSMISPPGVPSLHLNSISEANSCQFYTTNWIRRSYPGPGWVRGGRFNSRDSSPDVSSDARERHDAGDVVLRLAVGRDAAELADCRLPGVVGGQRQGQVPLH